MSWTIDASQNRGWEQRNLTDPKLLYLAAQSGGGYMRFGGGGNDNFGYNVGGTHCNLTRGLDMVDGDAVLRKQPPHCLNESHFDRLNFVESGLIAQNLDFLNKTLDEYQSKIYEVSQYHRNAGRGELQHQQWLQKRRQENAQRRQTGEDLLTEEDPNYAKLAEPSRVDSFLVSNQAVDFSNRIITTSGQTLQKLCLTDSLYNSNSIQ